MEGGTDVVHSFLGALEPHLLRSINNLDAGECQATNPYYNANHEKQALTCASAICAASTALSALSTSLSLALRDPSRCEMRDLRPASSPDSSWGYV
jgi:hypothetical protein